MFLKRFWIGLLVALLWQCLPIHAQLFQDYSVPTGIRHYAVDSLRISAGVVIFDFDNDGLDDLYLNGAERPHQLYNNLGDFDFENVTQTSGLANINTPVYGANAADLNNDGWEDLLLTTGEGAHSILLKNNGDGTFSDVTQGSGLEENLYWGTSITFADFNNDGFLDFYIGNYAKTPTIPLDGNPGIGAYPNELYLSQGTAFKYEEVAVQKGIAGTGFTLAVRATDFDQDFDIDLYVVNDFGGSGNEGNRYFENDGQGNFTDKSEALGLALNIFGMGAGLGDYDADGDFDLYVSDLTVNHFMQRQSDGTYENVADQTLALGDNVSWGAEFFDANNDSQLDLFIPNGAVLGDLEQPNQYYENINGQYLVTTFGQIKPPLFARGMGIADLDADGDLDVAVTATAEQDTLEVPYLQIYRNTANLRHQENGFLMIDLEGDAINRDAYGSILKLHLQGRTPLLKIKDNGGAYLSRSSAWVHFGIAEHDIDSLEVFWPDQTRTVYRDISKDAWVEVNQKEGLRVIKGGSVTALSEESLSDISVYPTATQGVLYVDLRSFASAADYNFFDLQGRLLQSGELTAGKISTIQIDGKINEPGLYLLQLNIDHSTIKQKIFLTRTP